MSNGVTITLDDYRDIGALEEALSAHADEVLRSLTEEQQRIAQTLFRRLTERVVGRGDRRRPSRLRDVAEVDGVTNEAVAAVVEEFRRADRSFLTPPPGVPLREDTILDITHESLITLWQTLNGWVEDEARSAAAYDRIKKTAHDWPKDADVLGGISLERAVEWRKKQQPTVAWARRYGTDEEYAQTIKFLDASEKEWEAHLEREATREKRERENEIEREKLKAKAKVARKLQMLTVALGVLAMFAAVAAGYALSKSNEAKRNFFEANAQRSKAETNLADARREKEEADKQREIATNAAAEASEQRIIAKENEAKAIAQADLAARREREAEDAKARALVAQREAETAKSEAIVEKDKAVQLASDLDKAKIDALNKAAEAQHERDLAKRETKEKENALKDVQASLDLAYEAQKKLNVENNKNLFKTERYLSTETAFSGDGSRVFTSSGQDASVWNTTTGSSIKTFTAFKDYLSAAFSRDGSRIVTADENGNIVLTDLSSLNERHFKGIADKPTRLILSGDARRLAVLDAKTGRAKVVDINSAQTLVELGGTWEPIVSISLSEDGQQLATTALDGESKLVRMRPGQPMSIESLATGTCRSTTLNLVDFSPRPDLRARLVLDSQCRTDEPQVRASPKLLPSERARMLEPAETVPNTTKKEGDLPEKKPVEKVTGPPVTTVPAETSRSLRSAQIRTERVLFRLDRRLESGDSIELAYFSMQQESDGTGQVTSLIEKLKAYGLSDDTIRKISATIIDVAYKMDAVKGDTEPERTKQLELGMELSKRILADLGITPPS